MSTWFLGIDPGLSGAIGVLDPAGGFAYVRDLPTVRLPGEGTVTRRLDGAALVAIFREVLPADAQALCYVEDVQAWSASGPGGKSGPGASTMAAMVGTKLVLLAILDLFRSRIDTRQVQPGSWKRAIGLQRVKAEGMTAAQSKTATKAASRAKAVALWPEAPIRQAQHDGRAEALLLAHYGREIWRGESQVFDEVAAPAIRRMSAQQLRNAEIDARVPLA